MTVSAAPPTSWGYQPALDGVRAVSVTLVLLFHGGVSWMHGGYVGVSVFFTLSGYLITSLLAAEIAAEGRVSFSRFYSRRLKRLMPASLLCVAAVVLFSRTGGFPGAHHVRREAVASALQVANWNALTQRTSYADLMVHGVGPLDHFWSLSVEEQFYWIWPISFALLSRVVGAGRTRVRAMIGLAIAAITAGPLISWRWGPDVAYWSTPARLAELLTGATFAALAWSSPRRKLPGWLAPIGLTAIVAAAALLPADHGPAYAGWLGAGSLASVALIAGLQQPGWLRTLLSARAIVFVGRISYGVYLFHWPIFVALSPQRTGWSAAPLLAARLGATLVVSTLSFLLIEQPIRRGAGALRWVAPLAGLASAAVAVAALTLAPTPQTTFGASGAARRDAAIAPSAASQVPVTIAPDGTPNRPVRLVVIGDSTAQALSAGIVNWAAAHPTIMQVSVFAEPGCGFVRSRSLHGDDGAMQQACDAALDESLPEQLRTAVPDVVVAMVTLPDITERTWDPAEGELSPLDTRYAQRRVRDYAALVDRLRSAGVKKVLWLRSPLPSPAWLGYLNGPIDPALWQAEQDALTAVAAQHPTAVSLVSFGDWLTARETSDSQGWRPDGLHLSADGGERVMASYLAPLVLAAAAN